MGAYQSPSLAAPHFQPDPAGLRALAARSEAGGAVGSVRAGPICRCRRPATPGGRAQTRAFSRAIGMRRGGRASRLVFSGPKAKAQGLPGALRRPEKAFSLVLLQAAASAPRPASSLEAIRASQRTSAGSVGTGDHGRPQPACLRHRRLTWHRLARSERDPRRSRAAKHVTNSNAALRRCRSVCDRQSDAAGPVAVGSYKTVERKEMQSDCSVKQQIEQQEDVKQHKEASRTARRC